MFSEILTEINVIIRATTGEKQIAVITNESDTSVALTPTDGSKIIRKIGTIIKIIKATLAFSIPNLKIRGIITDVITRHAEKLKTQVRMFSSIGLFKKASITKAKTRAKIITAPLKIYFEKTKSKRLIGIVAANLSHFALSSNAIAFMVKITARIETKLASIEEFLLKTAITTQKI